MPLFRGLKISLISQFDALSIPEYAPPSIAPDPFTDVSNVPMLMDHARGIVSVYIPTYPCSQFWISYYVDPPYPSGQLLYMKLYINGNCVVSWGCGEEEGYRGKTMFGLYASPKRRGIEQRSLAFGPPGAKGVAAPGFLEDLMEIRVYRCRERKRIVPEVKEYWKTGMQSSKKLGPGGRAIGIDLVNAGFIHQRHPQYFYKHALLDPVDQPYSRFRYYYRTWDQLEAMGVMSRPASTMSFMSSDASEQDASDKGSVEVDDSLGSVADTLKIRDIQGLGLIRIKGKGRANSSSSMESMTSSEEQAPMNSTPSITTTKQSRQYRPSTPPPSTFGPQKVAFRSTATGLIPTNLDEILPGLYPSWLTTPPQTLSSIIAPQSEVPTMPKLTPQASRESFTTLVRTRINSPNPEIFKLTDLSATIEKTSSLRKRQQVVSTEKMKRERTNISSSGSSKSLLRSAFSRDNNNTQSPRDESSDNGNTARSGNGRKQHTHVNTRSPVSSHKKKNRRKVKNARRKNHSSSASAKNTQPDTPTQDCDADADADAGAEDDDDDSSSSTSSQGEETENDEKKMENPYQDKSNETTKDKEKAKGKEKEKEEEKGEENENERGRTRSRSKKGEGRRKLNLWEEI